MYLQADLIIYTLFTTQIYKYLFKINKINLLIYVTETIKEIIIN